jgi:perosamine synthetase
MIPYGRHHIDEDDIRAVVDVLRGGALTQGPSVEMFERAVADAVEAKYSVAVSNCTAGLHLAALAAGLGPGAALVTSPITFVASANAALYVGATPQFADINAETVNLCPDSLARTLDGHPEARAVVPVHFAGLPCDMPAIKAAADAAGAIVIEDAAHALGAVYATGEPVGACTYSLMTVFSFHPVKAIAAGEGGMITTNDEVIYRRLLRLRSHGINKLNDPFQEPAEAETDGERNPWYYEMQELGYHFRITDIQCALALSQFGKLERFISRRRQLVQTYDAAFADAAKCRPAQTSGRDRSGHHIYVLRLDLAGAGVSRAQAMHILRAKGITTQVHYIPVPAQPHYRRLGYRPEDYPNAYRYYQEALTIPLFYDLTDSEQQHVISAILDLFG